MLTVVPQKTVLLIFFIYLNGLINFKIVEILYFSVWDNAHKLINLTYTLLNYLILIFLVDDDSFICIMYIHINVILCLICSTIILN